MRCYEVTDHSRSGLWIARFPEPHVPVRGREPLLLDPKLTELIQAIPKEVEGDLLLDSAILLFQGGAPRLAPEPPNWRDNKALVRVMTQTLNGTLALSAHSYTEELRAGRVVRNPLPFPPIGVTVVRGSVEPIGEKGDISLELLLVLEDGASFRITRTGDLQKASPEIFVHWRGGRLETSVPRRFRSMQLDPQELDPPAKATG